MIKPNSMSAFSLLEVLVALVILSLGFIAVFSAISVNTRALRQVQNKTAAHLVALNVLAETQLGMIDYSENNGNHSSIERMFDQDWRCSSSIQAGSQPGSRFIEIEVRPGHSATPPTHLTGYLRS